jgi:uncharacterized protein YkwD
MKTIRTAIMILALSAIALSCEKNDDDIHISGFEDQIHKAVNTYRVENGLNELAHNYNVLSRESKAHAKGRADGSISDSQVADDMAERWHEVEDKLGVTNVSNEAYLSGAIADEITSANAIQIATALVEAWASDSIGDLILKGDYTIHGPGEARTSDGRTYVMHMLCKFNQ